MKNFPYRTTLDKFGRVLIPKKIRAKLDLAPGCDLEIEERGAEITLHPAREQPLLASKEGVLVAQCHALESLEGFEGTIRSQRIRKLTGSMR